MLATSKGTGSVSGRSRGRKGLDDDEDDDDDDDDDDESRSSSSSIVAGSGGRGRSGRRGQLRLSDNSSCGRTAFRRTCGCT